MTQKEKLGERYGGGGSGGEQEGRKEVGRAQTLSHGPRDTSARLLGRTAALPLCASGNQSHQARRTSFF